MLSVCLCTWNDLSFLKLLYRSIKKNTRIPHEVIVHDNGSTDKTREWLKQMGIKHTHTEENEGVAAVNYAVSESVGSYVVDINADMFVLPGWDVAIWKQIAEFKKANIDKFMISSCLIEPRGANPEYSIFNAGTTPETFDETKLMHEYSNNSHAMRKSNTTQYSHPITMPRKMWDEIGGVDTEYPYGLATDHDIAARAYNVGCRNFKMLGNSRVYHFIGQTISKIPSRPNAEPLFFDKWGVTVQEFRNRMGIAQPFKEVGNEVLI